MASTDRKWGKIDREKAKAYMPEDFSDQLERLHMPSPARSASSRATALCKLLFKGRDRFSVHPMTRLSTTAVLGLRELVTNGFVKRTRFGNRAVLFELTHTGNTLRFEEWSPPMQAFATTPLTLSEDQTFLMVGSHQEAMKWANEASLHLDDWKHIAVAEDLEGFDSMTSRVILCGGPYSDHVAMKARAMGYEL